MVRNRLVSFQVHRDIELIKLKQRTPVIAYDLVSFSVLRSDLCVKNGLSQKL